MNFARYAIFYVPGAEAQWVQSCTEWLGWDLNNNCNVVHPELADLPLNVSEITQTPRKYGLHATLKPPFRLAPDQTEETLRSACSTLANDQKPVHLESLALTRMGRFLALCPTGSPDMLNAFAARCVSELDMYRAALTPDDLARRRGAGLSIRQEHNLVRWGYPHVMDLFRFHITLTGRLSKDKLLGVENAVDRLLLDQLPAPLDLRDLALVGEDGTGQFHLIQRYPLKG
jgi:putative phosphonate metabolism protein